MLGFVIMVIYGLLRNKDLAIRWIVELRLPLCVLQVFFFVAAIVLVATVSAGPMPGPLPLPAKELKGSESVYYATYPGYTYPAYPYTNWVYAG